MGERLNRTSTDLSGAWRVHPGEGDLHQRFVETAFDDGAWPGASVPGHWRQVPGLDACDGPVLYRRTFGAAPPKPSNRRFLSLDGVFYFGDVWLDETYLGATEGYFMAHTFEITELTRARDEHTLAVEVGCPRPDDPTAKRTVTGVFSHWDTMDPEWNPGGLWRPVRVVETGPVRIARVRCLCTEATEARGRLVLDFTLDAPAGDGPFPVSLVLTVTGPGVAVEARREMALAAGDNRLSWPVDVEQPPRWWPRRLGDQPLCTVRLQVVHHEIVSDECSLRTAFREVRLDRWVFHVNGERLYTMGSNHPPTRMALADATPEELRADVDLAVAANLDMLRIHAHVTRDELYDAADERGLLLWQDFPLQWGYARGLRRGAVAQARAMVDGFGHHPSIVLWCAHNEPLTAMVNPGHELTPSVAGKLAASMFLPTWNKDVLDRSLARALAKADGTRPVDRASGVAPGPFTGGTDSHLYFGWYHGEMGGLPGALRAWPRLARFVTEFGAQAVPDRAEFCEPWRWPDLDWDHLLAHHALQRRNFDRYVPPDEFATFAAWRDATQEYQAALIQLQCEDLRRLRFRPAGGFLQFCFADAHEAVTWSVLDVHREPKRGYAALRDACRPVLAMLDPRTGHVHIANETRTALAGATVTVSAGDGSWRFEGDAPADSLTFVGTAPLPETAEFATVVLEHPLCPPIENRYGPVILAGAHRSRWLP